MQLTLADAARLFCVSENTVARWIRQENLPTHEANSQYRFDPAELLEWATINRHPFSSTIFRKINGEPVAEQSLLEALDRGGVGMRVPGNDRQEVFRNAIAGLPANPGLDSELLLELLIARQKCGGTSISGGIAIPHPRFPLVMSDNQPILRVCFLAEPLELDSSNQEQIDTLFLLICPTVHEHLQLLARLASMLHSDEFRSLLALRPDKTRLLAAFRAADATSSSTRKIDTA